MFCPNCRQPLPDDSEFCQYCGSKLAEPAAEVNSAVPASVPELAGKTCPFCKAPFIEGEAVVFCSHCEMPHHLDCWKENGGCTTFGCTGNIGKIIGAEQKNVQSAPVATRKPAEVPKAVPYPPVGGNTGTSYRGRYSRQNIETFQHTQRPQYSVVNVAEVQILQGNLPVILEKVTLRKDETGALSAICRFLSIADAAIRAMQIDICCADIWREKLSPIKDVQYLDLWAKRDEPFGEERVIAIPDTNTRVLDVVVRRLILSDGTLFEKSEDNLSVSEKRPLSQLLSDDLINEYREMVSLRAKYIPEKRNHIWICACGAINREDEKKCHRCGSVLTDLLGGLNAEMLRKSSEKRLQDQRKREENEIAARREAERIRAEKEAIERRERKELLKFQQERAAQEAIARECAEKKAAENTIKEYHRKKKKGLIVALSSIAAFAVLLIGLHSAGVLRRSGEKPAEPLVIIAPEKPEATLTPEKEAAPSELSKEERIYLEADQLAAEGKHYEAATTFYKIKNYKDSWDRCFSLWGRITKRNTISKNFCVRENGTIVFQDNTVIDKELLGWENIEAIEVTNYCYCGLTSSGTVLTTETSRVRFPASTWNDIVAISAGENCLIGLKADGTVIATMSEGAGQDYGQCNVDDWEGIIMISTSGYHTVGLRFDGTVVSTGDNRSKQCEVDGWNNIVSISASRRNTIGVCKDGTAVAVGDNQYSQCKVSDWKDIVAVESNDHFTIGLHRDGSVVSTATSLNLYPWKDIVEIYARTFGIPLGLRSNGNAVLLLDSTVINGQEDRLTIHTDVKNPSA